MTTYDTLSVIHNLSVLGMDHTPIRDVMLDTIKKVAVKGDAPVSAEPTKPAGHPAYDSHWAAPSPTELNAYRLEGKIPAIKLYRARTGLCLRDSKDAIEQAAEALGLIQEKYEKHPLAAENERLKKLVADLYDAEERRVSCLDLHDEHHRAWADASVVARQYEGSKMPF